MLEGNRQPIVSKRDLTSLSLIALSPACPHVGLSRQRPGSEDGFLRATRGLYGCDKPRLKKGPVWPGSWVREGEKGRLRGETEARSCYVKIPAHICALLSTAQLEAE